MITTTKHTGDKTGGIVGFRTPHILLWTGVRATGQGGGL